MLTVAIIFLIAALVAFKSEVHALGIWVFLLITHGFLVQTLGDSAVRLPLFVGFTIMAVTIARGKWTIMRANVWVLIILLVVLMALAAMFGMDPNESISRLILYSKGFVLAVFIGGVLRTDSQVQSVTIYIIGAALFGAFIAYYQQITGSFTLDIGSNSQRAGGLAEDPNDTAMLLLTGVPLATYWLSNSTKKYSKVLAAVSLILIVGAIMLTKSRGGGLAMLMVLFLLFLRRPSLRVSVAGAFVLIAGLLLMPENYWDRMQSLGSIGDSKDGSLQIRLSIFLAGVSLFLSNPFLGVGIGNFGKALVESDSGVHHEVVAHNMYLEFFVENGAFAGILFLVLLGSAFLHGLKYRARAPGVSSSYDLGFCISMSLFGILINGLFLSQGKSAVLWFLVGIGLALPRLYSVESTVLEKGYE